MAPLVPRSDLGQAWTPDVIATVAYRIVMIITSLIYIWRKFHQPTRRDEVSQLLPYFTPQDFTIKDSPNRDAQINDNSTSSTASTSSPIMSHRFSAADTRNTTLDIAAQLLNSIALATMGAHDTDDAVGPPPSINIYTTPPQANRQANRTTKKKGRGRRDE